MAEVGICDTGAFVRVAFGVFWTAVELVCATDGLGDGATAVGTV